MVVIIVSFTMFHYSIDLFQFGIHLAYTYFFTHFIIYASCVKGGCAISLTKGIFPRDETESLGVNVVERGLRVRSWELTKQNYYPNSPCNFYSESPLSFQGNLIYFSATTLSFGPYHCFREIGKLQEKGHRL